MVENNIEQLGDVGWAFTQPAGYRFGLDKIENNPSFQGFERLYFFCRDLAITMGDNPIASQNNILLVAEELLSRRIVTQDELEYIYEQFKFDPETYDPPDTPYVQI